jgi:hypothetical protein
MSYESYVSWLQTMTDAELRDEFRLRGFQRRLTMWSLADLVNTEIQRRRDAGELLEARIGMAGVAGADL